MLSRLYVRNFAIIDRLELDFGDGMTVFTGETGAGKSIIIEALGFALGDRGDAGLIGGGAERAEVTAVFEPGSPALVEQLTALGLDAGDCMLRRQIGKDGRSRAFVNDTPVPIQVLRRLRELLVEIHGQHEHQALLRSEHQRALVDDFGGHRQALEAVRGCWRRYRDTQRRLDELTQLGDIDEDARELLRYQVDELRALDFTSEEFAELERDQRRLAHAAELMATCGAVHAGLTGEDAALQDRLAALRGDLAAVQAYEPELAAIVELLDSAAINLDEAARGLQQLSAALEVDPERLSAVEQRLASLHDVARKHRIPIGGLPEHLETLQQRLERLESASGERSALIEQLAEAEAAYRDAAAALSAQREAAAGRLSRDVSRSLAGLGMADSALQIEISRDGQAAPGPEGQDRVAFLVRTNKGQPFRPLAKIASGGELSRISLAIQLCALSDKVVSTLVFDEVDAGVGGRVAEIVGQSLRRLGDRRQVFCVTHLAQVASQSHRHLRVEKHSGRRRASTEVSLLDQTARIEEIARMLGGIEVTEQARGHAREMLKVS